LFADQLSSLVHLGERFEFHVIDADGTVDSVKGRISSSLGVKKASTPKHQLSTIAEVDFSPSAVHRLQLPRLSLPAYL